MMNVGCIQALQARTHPNHNHVIVGNTIMADIDSNTVALVCPVCQQAKPLIKEFWREHKETFKNKDGTETIKMYWEKYCCKSCQHEKNKEYDAKRKDNVKRKEYLKESYAKRKDSGKYKESYEKYNKKYRIESGMEAKMEAIKAWEWWIKEGAPNWWVKAYWDSHGSPWLNPRLSDAEAFRIKYKSNPEFQIKERMRRQVRKANTRDGIAEIIRVSLNNGHKSRKLESELDYTVEELKVHLERQFTKRMSWDKFKQGLIHIDHIIPKSQFNLSDPEEWKACWSLSNLRPLWAKDNWVKSGKVLYLL